MVEPWIRVHANLIAKPVVMRAADALGVKRAEAIGLLVTFWGAVSQHATNGMVGAQSDSQIEAWADWRGKRGKFASFIRDKHLDLDGRVNEWDEYQGPLETRRAGNRDRQKRHRDKTASRDRSRTTNADVTRDITRDVTVSHALTRANGTETERNGSTRDLDQEGSNRRSSLDLDQERGDRVRAAPLAGASLNGTATDPPADPDDAVFRLPGVQRFVETFYRHASRKRHADVARQLLLVAGHGAPHPNAPKDPNARIRARSLERLDRRCHDVVNEGVRDADKAIVVLLLKLADTSDISERTAAAERQQRERDEADYHRM